MKPIVNIHNLPREKVFEEAGKFLVSTISLFHNITQKTLILLSGGSSVNALPPLVEFIKTTDLDLGPATAGLAFAQVDERKFEISNINPATAGQKTEIKEEINALNIAKTGLWEECKKRKIPYYLVSQKGTLAEAAGSYNRLIEKLFREYVYKVAVLGIGEDGHTAGLLPGYRNIWDRKDYAVGYEIKKKEKGFIERISLTPYALGQLDYAVVAAAGEKKQKAIKKVFDQNNIRKLNRYPAVLLQKIPRVEVFITSSA